MTIGTYTKTELSGQNGRPAGLRFTSGRHVRCCHFSWAYVELKLAKCRKANFDQLPLFNFGY
jgi:hypothetical protein